MFSFSFRILTLALCALISISIQAQEMESSTTLDWDFVAADSDSARSSFTESNYFLKPGINQFTLSGFKTENKSDRFVPAAGTTQQRDYIETARSEGMELGFARGLLSSTGKGSNLMLAVGTTIGTDSLDFDRERLNASNLVVRRSGSVKSTGFSDFSIGLVQQNEIASNVRVQWAGRFWVSPSDNQIAVQGFSEGNRFSGGNTVKPTLAIEIQSGLMAYAVSVDYKHKLKSTSVFKDSGDNFESETTGGHESTISGAIEYSLSRGQIGVAGDYQIKTSERVNENDNGDLSSFDLDATTKWVVRGFGAIPVSELFEVAAQVEYSQLENKELNGFNVQQNNATALSVALRSNF